MQKFQHTITVRIPLHSGDFVVRQFEVSLNLDHAEIRRMAQKAYDSRAGRSIDASGALVVKLLPES